MALIMQRAIDIDETNSATQEELINALLLENRGLKEILAVHENMHRHKQLPAIIPEVNFFDRLLLNLIYDIACLNTKSHAYF